MASCEEPVKKTKTGTWFGGEIINPVDHVITLRKNDQIIAEIPLNQNNRFIYQIQDFEPGLYEFYHKERQLVYLEEGDSVMLRVNTYAFDESLTFSGYGAEENNLLIGLFLKNEAENASMARASIYQKNPKDFEKFMDSLENEHQEWMDRIENKGNFSAPFKTLATAVSNYDLYAHREVYPLVKLTKSKIELINKLPKGFYNYRDGLTFDHAAYLPSYSYKRFLINYFNQAAFKKYAKQDVYNSQSYIHNTYKLNLIDSLVPDQQIKSYLLTQSLKEYITNSTDQERADELYNQYLSLGPGADDGEAMEKLFNSFKNITPNKPIPDEPLINAQLENTQLRRVIRKPTVLYFWSNRRSAHMQKAIKRAKILRKRFPEYEVIGINMDEDHKEWLHNLSEMKASKKFAYQFKDKPEKIAQDLAINSAVKTIVLDKNGMILDAHTSMFSPDLEEKLLGYLNR